jgi:hypothetical protein
MPPTNAEMKKETRNDLSLPNPGCMYTGPTVVTFTSNGKMNVKSPWTKFTNVSLTNGIPSTNPAQCGTPGTAVGQLGSSGGATIDIVNANLIYAQNVPTVTTDPNYRSGTPSSFSCVNSNAGWTFSSAQYPASGEATPVGTNSSLPAYGCRNGDVFVKGVFNGQMTVAAENYVYVTGNLTYADNTDDMLGLVGSNGVWVWNPMKSSNTTPLLTDSGRTIEAAILSVAHTFQVQNYTVGGSNRGTLTILGSIAQRFRGPVSRTSGGVVTGYGSKDYNYDARLAHVAPPKFLSPVSSVYTVTQFASVPSAFSSTGTAQ